MKKWVQTPIGCLSVGMIFIVWIVLEIATPFPDYFRSLITGYSPTSHNIRVAYAYDQCPPITLLGVKLHRFIGYFEGMPPDAEVIDFLNQNQKDMERVVELFYDNVGINYGGDRFSIQEEEEYLGLLRKLCMAVMTVAFEPNPVRRLNDGTPGAYGDVIAFNGRTFAAQERAGAVMKMGKTLVYWPPGEFSNRFRSCSQFSLNNYVPKTREETTVWDDRCCRISGTWHLCVSTLL
ncbi:MAG: hypothetical protein HQL44_03710 [Alphaproteobacteria bacterium]|nr:hypothetical protein [Alphaproteobacteria bacterium]